MSTEPVVAGVEPVANPIQTPATPLTGAAPGVPAGVEPAIEAPKTAPPAPPAWSEYRATAITDPGLAKHAERFESPAALVQAHLELRKQLSSRDGLVKVPGEKSTPEEVAAWRKAVGVPEDAAGYALAAPEGADEDSKDRLGRFAGEMHKSGAPRSVVEAAVRWQAQEAAAITQRQAAAVEAAREEAVTKLRQEWGPDYPRNHELASRAFGHLADDGLKEFVAKAGLGDHPGMLKLFAKVGSMIAEDVPAIASGNAQIQSEFDAIVAERAERLDKGTVGDRDFQSRWERAFQRRYG